MLPSKKSKIEPVHVEEAGKLKALFDERNKLSQLAFGQRFEIGSQGMVWQYLNAKAPLNLDAALKFARALDCSVAEFSPRLASALGAPASQGRENGGEKDSPSSRHLSNIGPGPDIRGAVPLISWVQAGDWCGIVDNFAPGDAEEWLPCPVPHGPRTYVLRVRGESMWNPHVRPSFADGDLIFVDPDKDAIHGSMVIVRLDDKHEATFKRLVIEGDQRYLRAINPAWPEPIIQINGNAATICGVVILKAERV